MHANTENPATFRCWFFLNMAACNYRNNTLPPVVQDECASSDGHKS